MFTFILKTACVLKYEILFMHLIYDVHYKYK